MNVFEKLVNARIHLIRNQDDWRASALLTLEQINNRLGFILARITRAEPSVIRVTPNLNPSSIQVTDDNLTYSFQSNFESSCTQIILESKDYYIDSVLVGNVGDYQIVPNGVVINRKVDVATRVTVHVKRFR
jgi:hypothetical protein